MMYGCPHIVFYLDGNFRETYKEKKHLSFEVLKQGYKDSNLELTESESVALPFGDSPKCLCVARLSLATNDSI